MHSVRVYKVDKYIPHIHVCACVCKADQDVHHIHVYVYMYNKHCVHCIHVLCGRVFKVAQDVHRIRVCADQFYYTITHFQNL